MKIICSNKLIQPYIILFILICIAWAGLHVLDILTGVRFLAVPECTTTKLPEYLIVSGILPFICPIAIWFCHFLLNQPPPKRYFLPSWRNKLYESIMETRGPNAYTQPLVSLQQDFRLLPSGRRIWIWKNNIEQPSQLHQHLYYPTTTSNSPQYYQNQNTNNPHNIQWDDVEAYIIRQDAKLDEEKETKLSTTLQQYDLNNSNNIKPSHANYIGCYISADIWNPDSIWYHRIRPTFNTHYQHRFNAKQFNEWLPSRSAAYRRVSQRSGLYDVYCSLPPGFNSRPVWYYVMCYIVHGVKLVSIFVYPSILIWGTYLVSKGYEDDVCSHYLHIVALITAVINWVTPILLCIVAMLYVDCCGS